MSQPPKGTSFAPSWRWMASSGECRSSSDPRVDASDSVVEAVGAELTPGSLGGGGRRSMQAVLGQERFVVPLVEELHLDLGMQLPQAADLGVLAGHQLLVERRQLDEAPMLGKVEIGPEGRARGAVGVPFEDELDRFVVP